MDQEQQSRGRPTRRKLLWAGGIAVLVFFLIFVICGYLLEWKWTGFPKQTFWDWLRLLIVPVVLAIGGYLFTRSENRAAQAAAERRSQDDALQAYLDGMSQLLTDKELPLHTALSTVARARTLTVLARLDGGRQKRVLEFLHEARLINREERLDEGRDGTQIRYHARIVALFGADLRGADLRYIDLHPRYYGPAAAALDPRFFGSAAALDGAILENADLRNARLTGIDLGGSYLSGADLRGARLNGASLVNAQLQRKDWLSLGSADLRGADLSGADLSGADLRGTNLGDAKLANADLQRKDARGLEGANLRGANLRGADLTGANFRGADFRDTNLTRAQGITNEELEQQASSLDDATMPDRQKYEDWLKSKGSGKD